MTGLYTPNPIPVLIPASRILSLWSGAKASVSSSVSVQQYRTKRFYLQMVLNGVICGAAQLVHRLHTTTTRRILSIEQVSRFTPTWHVRIGARILVVFITNLEDIDNGLFYLF